MWKNAWLYDSVLKITCLPFGGEGRFRRVFIDFATVSEGDHILDACCGTGTLTSLLAEKVGRTGTVTGIDLSIELLEKATKKAKQATPLTFVRANCNDIPFPDVNFDKVFVSFGLHEITEVDRLSSLQEMYRVIKKMEAFLLLNTIWHSLF
ncbi:MAG: class I SAM-dependent methyltransferase [Dehalococcoidia bacterium]|nr:MAG: class I SAM-dependent methyltransferase [Dehalococcoidia bacterium]